MVYTGMALTSHALSRAIMMHLGDGAAVVIDVAAQRAAEAKARAVKAEQAKAQIAARRALKRKATADRRAAQVAADKRAHEASRKTAIPAYVTAFGRTYVTGQLWDEAFFLKALAKLCDLYGVAVEGCGCCGSPFLSTIDPGQTLIGYTNGHHLKPVFMPKVPDFVAPGEDSDAHGIGFRSSGRSY